MMAPQTKPRTREDANGADGPLAPSWHELVRTTRERLLALTQVRPGELARVARRLGVSKGGLASFLLGDSEDAKYQAWIVTQADRVYPTKDQP